MVETLIQVKSGKPVFHLFTPDDSWEINSLKRCLHIMAGHEHEELYNLDFGICNCRFL